MTHTPGPWIAAENLYSGAYAPSWIIRKDAQVVIGSVSAAPLHNDQSEANARLIAAAPEMLAALRASLEIIDPTNQYADPYFSDHVTRASVAARKIRAVIAQATNQDTPS